MNELQKAIEYLNSHGYINIEEDTDYTFKEIVDLYKEKKQDE